MRYIKIIVSTVVVGFFVFLFVLLFEMFRITSLLYQQQQQNIEVLEHKIVELENRQLEAQRRVYDFILDKDPDIDTMYASKLANTVCTHSNMFPLISPSLLVSLMWHESRFDTTAVSSKGAIGIMQVMPATSKWIIEYFGLPTSLKLTSLEDNVLVGCVYLNDLISRYGQFKALSIYNSGRISRAGKWYAVQVQQYTVDGVKLRD